MDRQRDRHKYLRATNPLVIKSEPKEEKKGKRKDSASPLRLRRTENFLFMPQSVVEDPQRQPAEGIRAKLAKSE